MFNHVIENTGYKRIRLSLISPSLDLSLASLTYMLVIFSSAYISIYLFACAGVWFCIGWIYTICSCHLNYYIKKTCYLFVLFILICTLGIQTHGHGMQINTWPPWFKKYLDGPHLSTKFGANQTILNPSSAPQVHDFITYPFFLFVQFNSGSIQQVLVHSNSL